MTATLPLMIILLVVAVAARIYDYLIYLPNKLNKLLTDCAKQDPVIRCYCAQYASGSFLSFKKAVLSIKGNTVTMTQNSQQLFQAEASALTITEGGGVNKWDIAAIEEGSNVWWVAPQSRLFSYFHYFDLYSKQKFLIPSRQAIAKIFVERGAKKSAQSVN